jgi:hypothetical protein
MCVCVSQMYISIYIIFLKKKKMRNVMFGQAVIKWICESDVENAFPSQLLLKWQDFSEATFSVCFSNKPMSLLCKNSWMFFIHPYPFQDCFLPKEIWLRQHEKSSVTRHNSCILCCFQKRNGTICVDALERGKLSLLSYCQVIIQTFKNNLAPKLVTIT